MMFSSLGFFLGQRLYDNQEVLDSFMDIKVAIHQIKKSRVSRSDSSPIGNIKREEVSSRSSVKNFEFKNDS